VLTSWLRRTLKQEDYWHGERRIGPEFRPGELGGYPVDLSAKAREFIGRTNEVGVPLTDYGGAIGLRLQPVTVCQVALGWHDRWLAERNPQHLERFLAIADWLMKQQVPWKNGGAWPIPITYHCYEGLKAPWVSALVQGQALSVLARVVRLRPAWARRARRAMEASFALFELDSAKGGVRCEDELGPAYEEYPSQPSSFVLNGLISALFGVYDYALVQGNGPARRAFDRAVTALVHRLAKYDLGFWSRYCLYPYPVPNVASPYYHRAHLAQLEAMAQLAPHPVWLATRARWRKYQNRASFRFTALAGKALFRLVHACTSSKCPRRTRRRRRRALDSDLADFSGGQLGRGRFADTVGLTANGGAALRWRSGGAVGDRLPDRSARLFSAVACASGSSRVPLL
jgi:heparosan-N-sulfate-glucuronate 5-epimerase